MTEWMTKRLWKNMAKNLKKIMSMLLKVKSHEIHHLTFYIELYSEEIQSAHVFYSTIICFHYKFVFLQHCVWHILLYQFYEHHICEKISCIIFIELFFYSINEQYYTISMDIYI